MYGPVMLDVVGTELTEADIARLTHPSTGGVILFARNFTSRDQVTELVNAIHEVRNPPLPIAVDQEGGRVQRFREGFTRLPAARSILNYVNNDIAQAVTYARELGWLMASELRTVGVDFSFAPVLDLNYGVSEVIGDRAFGDTPDQVAPIASAWMLGARDAGMISVGKHFPGHGAVVADSHLALPIDERDKETLFKQDIQPFAKLINQGLEGIMPAHVIYSQIDKDLAGFSSFWLQTVLRDELGFDGVIFSDDLSMKATDDTGDYPSRANAALNAGCDMVLVCNNPEAAEEVIIALEEYANPTASERCARLLGRASVSWDKLQIQDRWQKASQLAAAICATQD
jgi:beta-N-acetylhexosaminidase